MADKWNRRQINQMIHRWLEDSATGNIVGIETDDARQAQTYFPGATSANSVAGFFTNLTLTGLLYESNGAAITAGTTRTQAGAVSLTQDVNRIDTSTAPTAGTLLGDGVALPLAVAGLDIVVINNTANPVQVYASASGSDTINGIAGATGVIMLPNSIETFGCAAAGSWQFDAGVGYSGNLNTVLSLDSISAAGSVQGTATQLVADFNRIATGTSGQGVILPASAPGMDVIILNHTGNSIVVYGNGSDTIDDVAGATGVNQLNRSMVIFSCFASGAWYTNGIATGYSAATNGVVIETMQFADGVSAAGSGQSTATQLTAALNTVGTASAGQGVNLPVSSPGLAITVANESGNTIFVYAKQGSSDTINGIAAANGVSLFTGSIAVFNCSATGAWTVQPASTIEAVFGTAANTTGFTSTAAQVTGGVGAVDFALTGTLGAGANVQLPTVANLVLALHCPTIGTSYRLRIRNSSSANFPWTVTTNTGWTLTGTMSIAQNTWREFVLTLNTLTTATLQSVATGTYS